jgi:hypothetical protein
MSSKRHLGPGAGGGSAGGKRREIGRSSSPSGQLGQDFFRTASELARQHSGSFECRSLDVLHCAAAMVLEPSGFLNTDARQMQLAAAMGLKLGAL